MNKKSNLAELPSSARRAVRGQVATQLKSLHKDVLGYLKLYPELFSEFERTQLRRAGLEASRLADIIEERR